MIPAAGRWPGGGERGPRHPRDLVHRRQFLRIIATVKAGHGAQSDLHEFYLTPQGTALITAHRQVPADLSPLGGPPKGTVLCSIAQQIDVTTMLPLPGWPSRISAQVRYSVPD